jgi:hypothetical protein
MLRAQEADQTQTFRHYQTLYRKNLFGHCNRTLSKSAYLLSARVFHLEKKTEI